jgi:hypothetical protein
MATVCASNSNATTSDCQPCSFNCTNLAAAPYYTAAAPFGEVAHWITASGVIDASGSIGSPNTGEINTGFPSGEAFAEWLPNQPRSPAVTVPDPKGSITIESETKPAATAAIDPPATAWISCQAQVGMSPFLPSRNVPLGPEGRYHADGRNGVGSAFVGLWVASAEPADQRAPTARRPVEPSMLG